VRGVINLRGKVIPVIDLRKKFGLDHCEDTAKTCIIVVQIRHQENTVTMSTIIDEVKEVLDIKGDHIEETPAFGTSIDTSFILGMGKIGQTVKILLDIDKVLSAQEIKTINKAAQAA
jgi:purine-binding chemotaxis protein CheW